MMQASTYSDETAPDDRTITFWVGEALREDPRVWVANIDIDTKDGVVRLTGAVDTLMQRRYAGAIASKIRGVVRVENELDVAALPREDSRIAADVKQRLAFSSDVKIRGLTVGVEEGVVTIGGEAESSGYRAEADLRASEVPGVRRVRNALTVRPAERRSDDEIADELMQTFHRDVYLTGLPMEINCRNGKVVLGGRVGNAYQRTRAGELARNTNGVFDVVNEININQLLERGERRIEAPPTNDELIEAVTARLSSDARINATAIDVIAQQGHVTLRGTVSSMLQKQMAEVAARQVTGTVWVTNLLSVRTPMRPDEDLREDVVRLLEDDAYLRRLPITATVVRGVVTLRGTVSTHLPRMRAAELAGRIVGVRGVRNEIEVRWKSLFRDPVLAQQIRTRVRANWETTSVLDRINIAVTNGNVVLSGDVDTWAQRREAGRMAFFTTGVRSVQNRITIQGVRYPWEEWNSESNGLEPPPDWMHEFRGDFFERPGVVRM